MSDDPIRGPAYPFAIDSATGGVAWATEGDKLADNVRLILGMRIGERPMNRDFGTPIRAMVHETNDGGLARLLARHARDALTQFEPRILITDLRFEGKGGELVLEIHYRRANRPQAETLRIPLG
jgi:phage baseplate assembly protein W